MQQPIQIAINAILAHIDKGVKTDDIRKDYTKYVLSGETKEIVINEGGQDLQLGETIVKEMAARGHPWAKSVIADGWKGLKGYTNSPDKYMTFSKLYLRFGFSDDEKKKFENIKPREDPILISIIKDWEHDDDPKHVNVGGMNLAVEKVPVEKWAYKIINNDDPWSSEGIQCEFEDFCDRIAWMSGYECDPFNIGFLSIPKEFSDAFYAKHGYKRVKRTVTRITEEQDIPLTDTKDKKKEESPLSDNKAEIPLTDSKVENKQDIPLVIAGKPEVTSKKKKPKKHHKKQNKSFVSVSIPEATKKRKENSFVITEPSYVK